MISVRDIRFSFEKYGCFYEAMLVLKRYLSKNYFMLKNFRTFNLAVNFYQLCKKLKLHRSLYDQLYRATSSVCLNLAEGYGKPTYKDQRKFYYIAMGSFREAEAIILMEEINNQNILQAMDQLGGSLYKLCKSNTPYLEK